MNIVQISEQLKDVPDQFLMQEIQNPTGSYPSYLVVSELTRRKRMREGAIKQEPTTSVAEDLVGISGTPQAGQSTLGAAQQMMAQQPMPEMSMNVPQQMPQQMPQMMAGGGLVAFEQGGPIRAQTGLYVQPFQQLTPYEKPAMQPAGSMGELLGNLIPDLDQAERRIDPVTGEPVTLGEWMRRSEQRQVAQAQTQSPYAPYPDESQRGRITSLNKPMTEGGTAPSTQQKMAGEPRAGGLGAFKMPEYLTKAFDAALTPTNRLTEDELEKRGQAGIKQFEERMPDRESKILERRILERTEQLQKDKDMSFNEALFAAGAAILSAPGGGGMKWAGEGLKAFGQTLAQGKKDIRKSEDLLQQSELELIRAQTLRDQGKYAAYDKARQKALDMEDRGMRLAQSDAALGLKRAEMDINFAKLASEIGAKEAEAFYKRAYGKVLEQGGPGALTAAAKANVPPDFGAVMAFEARYLSQYPDATREQVEAAIKEQFPTYKPMLPPKPQIRGLDAPATLAPGT